jgi:sulfite exporter TauE/SafE
VRFLELLARLPARVWLQAILGLIGFVVLAVLGFALIAGVAAAALLLILGFKAKAWLSGFFAGRPPAPRNAPKVIDVPYEIVERSDDEKR